MKKTVFLFFISLFILKTGAFAQATNTNLSAHDRMIYLIEGSTAVEMPDSVLSKIRAYAAATNFPEKEAVKNSRVMKPLYDPKVSREDKIFACEYIITMCREAGFHLPVEVLNERYASLKKNNN